MIEGSVIGPTPALMSDAQPWESPGNIAVLGHGAECVSLRLLLLGPPVEALGDLFFIPHAARNIEARPPKGLGQVLLREVGRGRVMRVAVARAVAELLHERRGRVAEVRGHR